MKIQRFPKYQNRENILIELANFERLPGNLELPGPYFHVIIFSDHKDIASNDPLFEFLDSLLERGGIYFVCGGLAGGVTHDCIDELIVMDEVDKKWKYPLHSEDDPHQTKGCIMTTFHNEEPVEEVVWFALNAAYSKDPCMKVSPANLFFLLENSPYAGRVKECLKDPSNISVD